MDVVAEAQAWQYVYDAYRLATVPPSFAEFDTHFRASLQLLSEAAEYIEVGTKSLDSTAIDQASELIIASARESTLAAASIPDDVDFTTSPAAPQPTVTPTPIEPGATPISPSAPEPAAEAVDVLSLPTPKGEPFLVLTDKDVQPPISEVFEPFEAGTYRTVFLCDAPNSLVMVSSQRPEFSTIIRRGNGAFVVPATSDQVRFWVTCPRTWSIEFFTVDQAPSAQRVDLSFIVSGAENFSPSPNGEGCFSAGEYRDVLLGSTVIVEDGGGAFLTYSVFHDMERVGQSGCRFRVILFDLPDCDLYVVVVGQRRYEYSRDQLERSGWSIVITEP
jgi:hypothetical protein